MSEVKRTMVAELLRSGRVDTEVVVKGWVRTKRGNKNVAFIALNDGRRRIGEHVCDDKVHPARLERGGG